MYEYRWNDMPLIFATAVGCCEFRYLEGISTFLLAIWSVVKRFVPNGKFCNTSLSSTSNSRHSCTRQDIVFLVLLEASVSLVHVQLAQRFWRRVSVVLVEKTRVGGFTFSREKRGVRVHDWRRSG